MTELITSLVHNYLSSLYYIKEYRVHEKNGWAYVKLQTIDDKIQLIFGCTPLQSRYLMDTWLISQKVGLEGLEECWGNDNKIKDYELISRLNRARARVDLFNNNFTE